MRQGNRSILTRLALLLAAAPLAGACGSSPAGGTPGPTGTHDAGATGPSSDGGTGPTGPTGDSGAPGVPPVINYVAGVQVTTLAGSDVPGTADGTGAAAQFNNPTGMALDSHGNLLVTDYDSGRVRLVTPAGAVTTLAAGTGFVFPFASVVATDGTYYVETDANSTGVKDATSGTIWKVTPSSSVVVPAVAATGFGRPRSLAPTAGGNLFVVDRTQNVAKQLTAATGQSVVVAGTVGAKGYVDGTGASARFDSVTGAATMPDGSFVVADAGNNRIRRITAGGVVTTLAGTGVVSLVDGACASAGFNAPRGIAADAAGNVYVSDIGNHVIRRINAACVVETVAGDNTLGFKDGEGKAAELYGQEGIAVSADGKTLYVSDGNGGDGTAHHRVRKITIP